MTRPRPLIAFLFLTGCFISCKNVINDQDHPLITNGAISKASKLFKRSPKKAIKFIDSVYENIRPAGPQDLYKKYDLIGKYYFEHNDLQQALKYSDSLLEVLLPLSKTKNYNSLYALKLLDRGDILFKMGRFSEAYSNFYKGKTALLSEKGCDNPQFYYGFYSRLANVSYGQGSFREAIKWHLKAINSLSSCNLNITNAYQVQGTLDNIALCYSLLERPDSALIYYDTALALINRAEKDRPADSVNFEIAEGVILGNQGTAYYKKGDLVTAEQKFKQSIALNGKPHHAIQDALITKIKLTELYLAKNNLNAAYKVLNEIQRSKDTLAEPQDKLQLLMVRSGYAAKTGDLVTANKLLHNYIDLLYALKKAGKTRLASDFGTEFERLSSSYQLQAVKKNNQLKNIYLLIAALVFVMGAIIIYLLVKSRKRTKLNEKSSSLHNRQLETALNALESSSIENTRLLSLVAHDLKNPIHAIYGITGLMTSDKNRSEDDMEMLELIKVSSKNMDNIIRDLLSAKINRTDQKKEFAEADLGALLFECVSLLQYRAWEKRFKIILLSSPVVKVIIDRERIWRVVNNLLVNAIKFSHSEKQVIIGLVSNEKEAIVTVADSGIGIPAEISDKVFELSGGAKREGTSGEETFGLGLYISKQIIEEHNGRMWFESKVGAGTTFYFSLPLPSKS